MRQSITNLEEIIMSYLTNTDGGIDDVRPYIRRWSIFVTYVVIQVPNFGSD